LGRPRWIAESLPSVLPDRLVGSDALRVAVHLFVDHVGQVSFEGADGFHCRLAFGAAASVVRPARGVVSQLDDCHDVQDPVDAPVVGPRQAVTLLVTRRRLDGCGAVPRGEVPGSTEPADVTDLAQ
jgi:hypothetical protein